MPKSVKRESPSPAMAPGSGPGGLVPT